MKVAVSLLLLAGYTSANIVFNHVSLTCEPGAQGLVDGKTGCLRGQVCTNLGTCVAEEDARNVPHGHTGNKIRKVRRAQLSKDGKCGPKNGNLECDANSKNYKGKCCSPYGWCGDSAAHCGVGCLSGCKRAVTTAAPAASSTGKPAVKLAAPRADGRCGKDFDGAVCDPTSEYGGCCSQFGYCGQTSDHCLVEKGCQNGCLVSSAPAGSTLSATETKSQTQEPILGAPTATAPASGGGVTTDGTCGSENGNTVCGNWPQGGCCSMYGYCGNTDSHCGTGCQSGPCKGAPQQPAPGPKPAPAAPVPGSLALGGLSGVPAMHAGLMPNGKVIFLDKVENYTQMKLGNGQYAYSSEWDPATQKLTALPYKTNAFCSGGAFLPDGRWLSLGGNGPLDFIDPTVTDGFKAIRYLSRNAGQDGQAWSEPGNKLNSARWYATAQTMPDGTIFVASGSLNGLDPTKPENNNPTFEVLNQQGVSNDFSIPMEILAKNQPYYMYPFVHLMRDGNIFIFTSKSSESFNVGSNKTNRQYPDLVGDYRTYPNTGGSVLLPLTSANNWDPDIIICGGGAYQDITSPTDPSCGRIKPLSADPKWEMDSMPEGRGMVEGTLLPDGTIIWVNGCGQGAQGFGVARNPTNSVLIYDPSAPLGQRWSTGPTSDIARLYHSVALLLLDGTLLISGSNPVEQPMLTPVPNKVPSEDYVTEFRNTIYTPPYLSGDNANKRPTNINLSSKTLNVGGTFTIKLNAPQGNKGMKVSLYHGGFVTHSVHMNHRMAFLDFMGYNAGQMSQTLSVKMPPNTNVAPPGPYVVYVTVDGVPGIGQFVSVS